MGDPEFDPRHTNSATSGRHKQISSLCKGLCQEGQPDTNLGQTNLPLNLIFCSELWREQQEGKEEEVQALLLTKYLQQPKRVSRLAGVTDHMLPSFSGAGLKLMKLISHCRTRSRRCICLYFFFFWLITLLLVFLCVCHVTNWLVSVSVVPCVLEISCFSSSARKKIQERHK